MLAPWWPWPNNGKPSHLDTIAKVVPYPNLSNTANQFCQLNVLTVWMSIEEYRVMECWSWKLTLTPVREIVPKWGTWSTCKLWYRWTQPDVVTQSCFWHHQWERGIKYLIYSIHRISWSQKSSKLLSVSNGLGYTYLKQSECGYFQMYVCLAVKISPINHFRLVNNLQDSLL